MSSPATMHPAVPSSNGFRRLRLYLRIIAGFRRRRKVALLMGINYTNGGCLELQGSQKDIESLEELLRNDLKFDEIIILSDKEGVPESMVPTRANIFRVLETFISSHPGSDFFVAYSGHSSQRPDYVGEEDDGREEYIIPCDALDPLKSFNNPEEAFLDAFVISDKALNRFLVECLPKGSQLVALFDCCHSGTILNLRHQKCNQVGGYRSLFQDGFRRVSEPIYRQLSRRNGPFSGTLRRGTSLLKMPIRKTKMEKVKAGSLKKDNATRRKRRERCTGFCPRLPVYEKQVICFSSCDDSQITLDSYNGGAMIQSFVKLMKVNRRPTYKEVMKAIVGTIDNERKNLEDKMEVYLARKKCDRTCAALHHRWCLNSEERIKKALIRAKCEPQLSSLRPLNTNAVLKL